MRTPRLPVVDWTHAPADLNGLVRVAERRNLVSAHVPSHFKRSLRCLSFFFIFENGTKDKVQRFSDSKCDTPPSESLELCAMTAVRKDWRAEVLWWATPTDHEMRHLDPQVEELKGKYFQNRRLILCMSELCCGNVGKNWAAVWTWVKAQTVWRGCRVPASSNFGFVPAVSVKPNYLCHTLYFHKTLFFRSSHWFVQ